MNRGTAQCTSISSLFQVLVFDKFLPGLCLAVVFHKRQMPYRAPDLIAARDLRSFNNDFETIVKAQADTCTIPWAGGGYVSTIFNTLYAPDPTILGSFVTVQPYHTG